MSHKRKSSISVQNQITEGVIWKQLLLFFFPILFGTFFQQLYNTVDAIIVGRFVGKEGLAAVGGSAAMIINLLVGFFIGLSSGATVIISQFYGARQQAKVSQAVHTAVAFSIAGGLVIMATGLIIAPAALRAMGTPEETMTDSILYLRIYFLGLIGNLLYNMGSGILRAIGDSKRPLYFLIAGCMTNIVLDIVLVLFFRMGVAGAAWATILSQLVSAILVTATLLKTDDMYRLVLKDIRIHPDMLLRIIQIGLPAGLQSVMYSASNIIIQANVNALGTNVVAAWTAYGKIDVIYWTIINAFGISITTFVGQNFGAGKLDRVYKGIRVCLGISAGTTIFLSLMLYHFGQYIYLLFTTDAEVIAKGVEILHFLVPTLITYVCIEILSGALRGIGDCWIPMIMTALGVCLLRVVWIVVAVPLYPDIKTICFSYPLTWTVTSILFLVYFKWFSKIRKMKGIQ
ncbi:MAG: MATE family efflux transporter [Lachnospiraceae bacterium]